MNSTCSLLVYFLNVNEVKTNYCLSSSRLTSAINTVHANRGQGVGRPSRNRTKSSGSMSKVLGSLGSILRCWPEDFHVWGRQETLVSSEKKLCEGTGEKDNNAKPGSVLKRQRKWAATNISHLHTGSPFPSTLTVSVFHRFTPFVSLFLTSFLLPIYNK